jgi:hypothetical protein
MGIKRLPGRNAKRRKLTIAVGVPLIMMLGVILSASASADTLEGNFLTCAYHGSSSQAYCLNNWNGTAYAGKQLRIYQHLVTPNSEWNWWDEGTVSSANNWPWSVPGTTYLNTEYNGDTVYKFAWAPGGKGSGWCVDQRSFDAGTLVGNAILEPCQPTSKFPTYQYFVQTSSQNMIAVWATAVEYNEGNALKVALTTTATTNGNYVYLEGLGNGDDQWYPQ